MMHALLFQELGVIYSIVPDRFIYPNSLELFNFLFLLFFLYIWNGVFSLTYTWQHQKEKIFVCPLAFQHEGLLREIYFIEGQVLHGVYGGLPNCWTDSLSLFILTSGNLPILLVKETGIFAMSRILQYYLQ